MTTITIEQIHEEPTEQDQYLYRVICSKPYQYGLVQQLEKGAQIKEQFLAEVKQTQNKERAEFARILKETGVRHL